MQKKRLVTVLVLKIMYKNKTFPSHMGSQGYVDLRFCNPQPDNSFHCEATDSGLSTFVTHRVL